jgi:hypothetical protein
MGKIYRRAHELHKAEFMMRKSGFFIAMAIGVAVMIMALFAGHAPIVTKSPWAMIVPFALFFYLACRAAKCWFGARSLLNRI